MYAFASRRASLKIKIPSKNAYSKDEFFYFRLTSSSSVRSRWNLSNIADKLDKSVIVPGFDVLEGPGNPCKLTSRFDKRTLVYVDLSQAQLGEDSDETQAPSIPCAPFIFIFHAWIWLTFLFLPL